MKRVTEEWLKAAACGGSAGSRGVVFSSTRSHRKSPGLRGKWAPRKTSGGGQVSTVDIFQQGIHTFQFVFNLLIRPRFQ
jgi:hypothetical protein